MQQQQDHLPPTDWDWSFLEYHRKSVENETDPKQKSRNLHCLRHCEATRDFWNGSIKQINPLIQFDPEPNNEITEARIELYKISISFTPIGKFLLNSCAQFFFRITLALIFGTLVPKASKLNLASLSSSMQYDQRVDKVEN